MPVCAIGWGGQATGPESRGPGSMLREASNSGWAGGRRRGTVTCTKGDREQRRSVRVERLRPFWCPDAESTGVWRGAPCSPAGDWLVGEVGGGYPAEGANGPAEARGTRRDSGGMADTASLIAGGGEGASLTPLFFYLQARGGTASRIAPPPADDGHAPERNAALAPRIALVRSAKPSARKRTMGFGCGFGNACRLGAGPDSPKANQRLPRPYWEGLGNGKATIACGADAGRCDPWKTNPKGKGGGPAGAICGTHSTNPTLKGRYAWDLLRFACGLGRP